LISCPRINALLSPDFNLIAFERFGNYLFLFNSVREKMFRSAELKIISRGQNLIGPIRVFSAQPAQKAAGVKFQDEWDNAKPYESIPSMGKFGVIRSCMPGGEKLSC
jgi:hypothetical protein